MKFNQKILVLIFRSSIVLCYIFVVPSALAGKTDKTSDNNSDKNTSAPTKTDKSPTLQKEQNTVKTTYQQNPTGNNNVNNGKLNKDTTDRWYDKNESGSSNGGTDTYQPGKLDKGDGGGGGGGGGGSNPAIYNTYKIDKPASGGSNPSSTSGSSSDGGYYIKTADQDAVDKAKIKAANDKAALDLKLKEDGAKDAASKIANQIAAEKKAEDTAKQAAQNPPKNLDKLADNKTSANSDKNPVMSDAEKAAREAAEKAKLKIAADKAAEEAPKQAAMNPPANNQAPTPKPDAKPSDTSKTDKPADTREPASADKNPVMSDAEKKARQAAEDAKARLKNPPEQTALPVKPEVAAPVKPDIALPVKPDVALPVKPEVAAPVAPKTPTQLSLKNGAPGVPKLVVPINYFESLEDLKKKDEANLKMGKDNDNPKNAPTGKAPGITGFAALVDNEWEPKISPKGPLELMAIEGGADLESRENFKVLDYYNLEYKPAPGEPDRFKISLGEMPLGFNESNFNSTELLGLYNSVIITADSEVLKRMLPLQDGIQGQAFGGLSGGKTAPAGTIFLVSDRMDDEGKNIIVPHEAHHNGTTLMKKLIDSDIGLLTEDWKGTPAEISELNRLLATRDALHACVSTCVHNLPTPVLQQIPFDKELAVFSDGQDFTGDGKEDPYLDRMFEFVAYANGADGGQRWAENLFKDGVVGSMAEANAALKSALEDPTFQHINNMNAGYAQDLLSDQDRLKELLSGLEAQ